MGLAPSPLPTRFPCWCRAVYSWGGESKRDLGFIEGDLIECLNAGDGSWWVGKLYRDRRTVGSFPSNFVEVLPESFRPTTRTVSPLIDSNSPSPKTAPSKSKTFRKPFEAYVKAPHYTTAKQPETFKEEPAKATPPPPATRSRDNSGGSFVKGGRDGQQQQQQQQYDSYSSRRGAVSPAPSQYRARSPAPMRSQSPAPPRSHSPAPPQHYQRGPSPAPYHDDYRSHSPAPPSQDYRSHSPAPFAQRARSPAPFQDYRSHSPAPPHQQQHYRSHSPAPPQDFRSHSPAPPPHHHHSQRGPSPAPSEGYRAYSPAPRQYQAYDPRAPSPIPAQHTPYESRGPSPAPDFHRDASPAEDLGSPPPPAPPPHRHVTTRPGSARPVSIHMRDRYSFDGGRQESNGSYKPFTPSRNGSTDDFKPAALSRNGSKMSQIDTTATPRRDYSPGGHQMTPSPLREAMDGVMEQLDELSGYSNSQDNNDNHEAAVDPWSPACFDLVSRKSRREAKNPTRPLTSMGIAHSDEGYETWSGGSSQNPSFHEGGHERSKTSEQLPQLSNYVARMEKQFETMHKHSKSTPSASAAHGGEEEGEEDMPPPPPPKGQPFKRPKSSMGERTQPDHKLRTRKSMYDVSVGVARTFTTKTNSTNASTSNQSNTSSSTQSSSRTLWSGASASGFSSTSAGSLARTNQRAQSALGMRDVEPERPETPFTGVTYHSSHASGPVAAPPGLARSQTDFAENSGAGLGGLVQPKAPRRNIFRKIFDTAKTGVASSRGSIAAGSIGAGADSIRSSPLTKTITQGSTSTVTGFGGGSFGRNAAKEMGLDSGGVDWVQVRRDVNRSNSLSKTEKGERRDRCQMMDQPMLNPVDELYESVEGDEAADGSVVQQAVDYRSINLNQVDKNSRFISSLPPMTTAITLATTYVCRPYRSDVQRLRAIFTWVSENITWEEDFEGEVDTRQVIQGKRACAKEYAFLVQEMCEAVGLQAEVVRGYLKGPGEVTDVNMMPRPNHWWNAVIVDNEWRILDCCLASPSNPKRGLYSSSAGSTADSWWFLMRPLDACWTHIPDHHDQQHILPPVAHEVLLNLPCACAPFFRNDMEMYDYNTSLTRIEDLEMVHIKLNVPADVEIAAEVEARGFTKDDDGDTFESGDVIKKRALAQAEWYNGVKRYTIKALLPGDEGQGVLKIYAGKRGLMHSIKDVPHPLALSVPVVHTGDNPSYEFVTRHPTPHAQRHDIYVVQPQCQRLALNNTFVFAIRQHPSSTGPQNPLTPASNPGGATTSPIPFARPGSAMSMTASITGSSNPSSSASGMVAGKKPAKLAIQTPGGKILRLMRKEDRNGRKGGSNNGGGGGDEEVSDGGTWETIIKCSERGVWRGLVLADRTARWCVFAEWVCVG